MATKTKTAHTPGPWGLVVDHRYQITDDIESNSRPLGGTLAEAFNPYEAHYPANKRAYEDGLKIQEANARLIASAPELLEACRNVVNNWEGGDLAAAARQCSTAIAKATE